MRDSIEYIEDSSGTCVLLKSAVVNDSLLGGL